ARLGLADLALDTRIYNGHTTTLDALWAGVPVLTCKGHHFASLVSDSNLKAIGLTELSVPDLETYRNTAIDLARNPGKLKIIRQKLAENRLTTPLFDTDKTVRDLEKVYLTIWRQNNDHSTLNSSQ
ncbi:MAG: UDP-N-acetylglucosamine-peptide N-acetylglucosaminyltransferase, partial [Thermodesulfobacteriota bacterium]|nr:UDP-N-acetylglucosamine-peptide N-acetylglucosaminyltransferase [Thermodesulfobacteriota bacterium]